MAALDREAPSLECRVVEAVRDFCHEGDKPQVLAGESARKR
jgi:hypothetical protein